MGRTDLEAFMMSCDERRDVCALSADALAATDDLVLHLEGDVVFNRSLLHHLERWPPAQHRAVANTWGGGDHGAVDFSPDWRA